MRRIEFEISAEPEIRANLFEEMNAALEWVEGQLLAEYPQDDGSEGRLERIDHPLCSALDPEDLAKLKGRLEQRKYSAGEFIVRVGDDAFELLLLMSGQVSVTRPTDDVTTLRPSTPEPFSERWRSSIVLPEVQTCEPTRNASASLSRSTASRFSNARTRGSWSRCCAMS